MALLVAPLAAPRAPALQIISRRGPLARRAAIKCLAASSGREGDGEAFLQKFRSLSGEALSAPAATGGSGCCGGSQHEAPGGSHTTSSSGSGGGCGCNGTRAQEEAAAQGVISAFGQMVGGLDGPGVSREDLAAAFSLPLGEAQADSQGERFWDVREVLAGAPSDLVFEDDGEDLDTLVV